MMPRAAHEPPTELTEPYSTEKVIITLGHIPFLSQGVPDPQGRPGVHPLKIFEKGKDRISLFLVRH